ncbi:YheC/YheD family protein [Paenibacillus contaminans]|uniref:YheC/YheD family protein n=1 Tax=Paenibacillus contaminans TaxID=450362 RepID=A0A329M4R3_9BACL|nr:YheC/YheD family protein [Paenibacillus contaminans]RAV14176.1 YheC/YheD family protein [Paenibacillus contaminans]
MSYPSATMQSKWVKTKWLLTSPNMRKYIPQTLLFSRSSLSSMLLQYSTVYFKPTGGTGGFNIFRITKLENGYQIQHNSVKTRYATFDALYGQLLKRAKARSYLLQKGIKLAATNGRPFDIRVMVQKTNKGVWESTALFTKIGVPGKVATNYNQGGEVSYFRQTLSGAGFGKADIDRIEAELRRLGKSVGRLFDRHKQGFRELGLDVALDSSGRAWILEVNTRPQFYPLKHMGAKRMYRRIISYAKQYGRKK